MGWFAVSGARSVVRMSALTSTRKCAPSRRADGENIRLGMNAQDAGGGGGPTVWQRGR